MAALHSIPSRSRFPIPCLESSLVFAVALLAACGQEDRTPDVSAAPPPALTTAFEYAGMYEVSGVTRVDGSDVERSISGQIVMTPEADGFASTFSLSTRFGTPDGVVAADLNGNGEGTLSADGLAGTADTQMILAAAPGLDPKFGFLPGHFGPRIRSTWRAVPEGADRLRIEIATVGSPGEEYQSTKTSMIAERTSGPSELKDRAAAAR